MRATEDRYQEYVVVQGEDSEELVSEVNTLLQQGWVVCGAPIVAADRLLTQALTRYVLNPDRTLGGGP